MVLALTLLLAVALLTFLTSIQNNQWAVEARKTRSTLLNLKNLFIQLQAAESTGRGFLLTGDREFLAEQQAATRKLAALLPKWDQSPVNDTEYRLTKAQFERAVKQRLALLHQSIALKTSSVPPEILSSIIGQGRQQMLQIANLDQRLEQFQEDALNFRRSHAREYARFSQLIASIGCCGVFALLLWSTVRIHALISARTQLTEKLSKSEAEFRSLADGLPQMVWRATSFGDLEYVNAVWRDFSRMSLQEALQSWPDLLHPDERDQFLASWHHSRSLEVPLVSECRLRDSSGRYHWFLFRTTPVQDPSSGYPHWYCTFTDIDEQKITERALHLANEELRQFAYAAAHDLQEPLRNVASLLGLLRRKHREQLTETAGQWVDETVDNAKRMHNMVKDLLAYTRALDIREGAIQGDSNMSILAAMSNLQPLIDETGAKLTCDPLPRLNVLPSHLLQILQNLLSNGIKFRKPNETPMIHIAAERRGHEWLLSISDNGIGFDPAYADRIFGVFKRLHTQGEYPGTGMGLAICYRIVAHYGGRIWAESQPGEGATFRFTLPARDEEEGKVPPYSSDQYQRRPT